MQEKEVKQIVFQVFLGLLLKEDEDVVDYSGCTVSTGLSSTTLFVDDCGMPKDIQFVSLATFSSVEDGKARTCLAMGDWESLFGYGGLGEHLWKVLLSSPALGKTYRTRCES